MTDREPRGTGLAIGPDPPAAAAGAGAGAAAVTYFGFLSFFPLVALAFAVLGFVVAGDTGLEREVERLVRAVLRSAPDTSPADVPFAAPLQR